jgi:hypothetical protein
MRHLLTPGRWKLLTAFRRRQIRHEMTSRITVAAAVLLVIAPSQLAAQKKSASKPAAEQGAVRAPATSARAQVKSPSDSAGAQPDASSADAYVVSRSTQLLAAPASSAVGAINRGASVQVLSRDRGWVRVRVEAWVPDSVLAPADTNYRAGLSAADLMADPAAARGRTVVWNVQFLALQTADPLRKGMTDGEPYLLARGPDSENALLYLVVPPSLLGTARALQPLARITVTARVREGRSEPVGVPILDIQTINRSR